MMHRVLARRLVRQHLHGPPAQTPAQAVRAMVGAHAQIPSAAELQVALRLSQSWDVADPTLVRTFGPRGTLHLLPADDLPWWTAALAAVPRRTTGDDGDEAVLAALADLPPGDHTAAELDGWLADRVGPQVLAPAPAFGGDHPAWRTTIEPAVRRGLLVFGPPRGRTTTLRSAPTPQRRIDPAEAVHRLVHDYLSTYGPSDAAALARWLAAPLPWARTALADIDTVDTDTGLLPADDADLPDDHPPAALLLPYFDPYLVGAVPRDVVIPNLSAMRNAQPGTLPVVLHDGIAAGVWHLARRGRRGTLTLDTELPTALLKGRIDQLAALLGLELEVRRGPLPVGGHA
jgi:hypothetical protein